MADPRILSDEQIQTLRLSVIAGVPRDVASTEYCHAERQNAINALAESAWPALAARTPSTTTLRATGDSE